MWPRSSFVTNYEALIQPTFIVISLAQEYRLMLIYSKTDTVWYCREKNGLVESANVANPKPRYAMSVSLLNAADKLSTKVSAHCRTEIALKCRQHDVTASHRGDPALAGNSMADRGLSSPGSTPSRCRVKFASLNGKTCFFISTRR